MERAIYSRRKTSNKQIYLQLRWHLPNQAICQGSAEIAQGERVSGPTEVMLAHNAKSEAVALSAVGLCLELVL